MTDLHELFNLDGKSPTESMLTRVENFLEENGLVDLSGELEEFITLSPPERDETLLGELIGDEKRAFMVATLTDQAMREYIVDEQTIANEKITAIMLRDRIPFHLAAEKLKSEPHDETVIETQNMYAVAYTLLTTMYEFSLRQRLNSWSGRRIIIRTGYIVYMYG